MSDRSEPEDDEFNERPSKSQRKRDVKAITDLGEKLMMIPQTQLDQLPYPKIVEAIRKGKKINKGNARKRQLQYIGKLLRKVDLQEVHELIDRFDTSSRAHVLQFQQLETWRELLIKQDKAVMGEILHQLPDIDIQHLHQLVRNAVREADEHREPPIHFRKLFQYLKMEAGL
ncbi:MAG TPA: ribosome biogenesis factor YjgA [Pseudomonadales bacterium]|jgi:ribosome-associated protein|nr:ribosome biogenesis factor YjgA [Pseudomonadales bacterium]MDP6316016.1 ribosome biogenesis factor YjgA [Pseudomonadales bacterium]MDP7313988.1 ribosome biogenesis factor YjgA [Pseudomonadales bacterium]HJL60784.1 ribosome biogenesis factor YjgA [Pseudomonadales bacterium]HJP53061.1 ribosome biogenesis factor YjgA [Pseudomonadales bacterium]|tara:strand:- start:593 stop:1108 length:516 start_codon:yes stop_codon:yes gene_type:complete